LGAAGAKFEPGPEHDTTVAKDNLVAGKSVFAGQRHGTDAYVLRGAAADDTGATVVVFPGGSYRILALDLEGRKFGSWLNSIGVNAALVKYRVPEPPAVPRYAAPLQDAQRAVGIVRGHAAIGISIASNWRVGILGRRPSGGACEQRLRNALLRVFRRCRPRLLPPGFRRTYLSRVTLTRDEDRGLLARSSK